MPPCRDCWAFTIDDAAGSFGAVDPAAFLADLEAKPATLLALLDDLPVWPAVRAGPVVLTGMGSSWFAADVCARRLRRHGIAAVAELASVEATFPPSPDLTVIGITASGRSAETAALLEAHHGVSRTIALTNDPSASLPADRIVSMHAGIEHGGVACRTYLHTLVALLALEQRLTGVDLRLGERVRRCAAAIAFLLDRRDGWMPPVLEAIEGTEGMWLLAPAERIGSALQGALMVREGPRRAADGCETGDWNHVDVYLTKTLDYRALIFSGSRFDSDALRWMTERHSHVVTVGQGPRGIDAGAGVGSVGVRYPGDGDPVVALLTEVIVAELLAAHWWLTSVT
jgi:glucosamine 6-phosphate synthetase-like amidotransferase/phosphosugar isomerase protein